MPAPRPFDYAQTFKDAIDSTLKSLQTTMDEEEASRAVPMEEMEETVRQGVEEEYEHMERLRDELVEESAAGPARFARFVEKNKGELGKALNSYEKRLKVGMKAAKGREGHPPRLTRTREELELVKLARRALDASRPLPSMAEPGRSRVSGSRTQGTPSRR